MVLAAHRDALPDFGNNEPRKADLSHLATGRGVRIGDGNRRLSEKFGPPTSRKKIAASRTDVWRYRFDGAKDREGVYLRYEAVYTFVRGRLVGIAFYQDLIGGA